MPRRSYTTDLSDEPPRKRSTLTPPNSNVSFKQGEVLTDIAGKQWILGQNIGVGGFGQVYTVLDACGGDSSYVAKIENHQNGPLFVEINCYLRIAKREMIEKWKTGKKLDHLGMPHYVASGSHSHKNDKFRFLILPKFERDLEEILQTKKMFNLKTVLTISSHIIDVLEYIHNAGYIHSDIKASNILLRKESKPCQKIVCKSPKPIRTCRIKKSVRTLRPKNSVNYVDDVPNFKDLRTPNKKWKSKLSPLINKTGVDQLYLLDYGLASKFQHSNGEHKEFCTDQRRAHAGTVLFCSCDAHKGVQSRRSDLESLGYNMIYWLTGTLPWFNYTEVPEAVERKKLTFLADLKVSLNNCFTDCPKFLLDYFNYLRNLQFAEKPDYTYLKKLFKSTLLDYGYKDDSCLDFDNLESWGQKQKDFRVNCENKRVKSRKIITKVPRFPLQSNNIPIKPVLRKTIKNKKYNRQMRWSKILTDPEIILKQSRKHELSDCNSSINIANLDINSLNPTPAMLEVFNKSKEISGYSPSVFQGSGDFVENLDGYTPAMMTVHNKMKERRQFEFMQMAVSINNCSRNMRKRKIKEECPKNQIKAKSAKTTVVKKEIQLRKIKSASTRRTYSLRG